MSHSGYKFDWDHLPLLVHGMHDFNITKVDESKGWGVFANKDFKKGEIVMIASVLFSGNMESNHELAMAIHRSKWGKVLLSRMSTSNHWENDKAENNTEGLDSEYYMKLCDMVASNKFQMSVAGRVLGGAFSTVPSMINHACNGHDNCEYSATCTRVVVIASKSIKKGEEFTITYGDDIWFECECAGCDMKKKGICFNPEPLKDSVPKWLLHLCVSDLGCSEAKNALLFASFSNNLDDIDVNVVAASGSLPAYLRILMKTLADQEILLNLKKFVKKYYNYERFDRGDFMVDTDFALANYDKGKKIVESEVKEIMRNILKANMMMKK